MINGLYVLLIAVFTSYISISTLTKSTFENLTKKEEPPKLLPALTRIGSTTKLGKDGTCAGSGDILAYAKTKKYRIYVCGDETNNQPQSMIFFTEDKVSHKTIIDENPSISWFDRSYKFRKQDVLYTLGRPWSIGAGHQHIFFLDINDIKDRYSSKTIAEDPIQVYLFNEKVVPNYRKTILSPDDQENEQASKRFLKFLPTLKNQFAVCSESYEGRIITWDLNIVRAYEIAPQKYLVEIICDTRTYNFLTQYILYSEEFSAQNAKPIPFYTLISPVVDKTMEEKLTIWGVNQFFPEDNTLRVQFKAVGSGGWGNAQEYKLIEDRFELQEYRKYPNSGNAPPKSPEEFPKIYP
ncbi:hypothetical protein [Pseudanabaena sp. UWO310]|uniref:hypothetical protein n=1 Tax=Pseudanabaena sp. UWO310 TaxID=2480795 RepID=UPI001157B523|nr:hypothetical protein [Pseudanabaena sp. UWO310]TYQ31287.1 hypothetical protein PseudUWO310_04555 [Pseudanabaena sp. UWO310]